MPWRRGDHGLDIRAPTTAVVAGVGGLTMGWRDWEEWSRPIPVEHGIRARSQRGRIGERWWSRRFVEALSTRVDEGRLARGKRYARVGQVVSLDIGQGKVSAKVQGSRPAPYVVAITAPVLTDERWRSVETHMASRARTLASLLNGEMPHEVEESFAAAGADLFGIAGIRAACTCPDDAPLCKHIAAVFLLMAEAFDSDPFRMLAWRGRRREDLLRELRAIRATETGREEAASPAQPEPKGTTSVATAATAPEATPDPAGAPVANPDDPAAFWGADADPVELRVLVRPTTPPDAILRDADDDTVAGVGRPLLDRLRPIYEVFVPAARRRLDPAAAQPTRRDPSAARRATRPRPAPGRSPVGVDGITRSEASGSHRPRRG